MKVGRVGLGTVKLGRNSGLKYPEAFELPSESEVREFLETSWELGVRLYDTAPAYGSSEERLAPFVARHRKEMILCTKCGEEFGARGSRYDYSGRFLRASVEASLRRLGTEYLDILLIHSNGDDRRVLNETDAVETLSQLKREGKARVIGISAKTPEGVRGAARSLDVVMAPYSLASPHLSESLEEVHGQGLGVLAIKGLQSGHLAVERPDSAEEALRHVFSRSFLDVLILGTIKSDHLAQAVALARVLDDSGR